MRLGPGGRCTDCGAPPDCHTATPYRGRVLDLLDWQCPPRGTHLHAE